MKVNGENTWNQVKSNFPDLDDKHKEFLFIKDEVFYIKQTNRYIEVNNTGIARLK